MLCPVARRYHLLNDFEMRMDNRKSVDARLWMARSGATISTPAGIRWWGFFI